MPLIISSYYLTGCGSSGGASIGVVASSETFQQSNTSFNPKIDILWVVDPSRSMFQEIQNVENNIQSFMQEFYSIGYDFQMGVIHSAAWAEMAASLPGNAVLGKRSLADLHSGECVGNNSNPKVLSSLLNSNLNSFLADFGDNFDIYGSKLGTVACGLEGPPFASYPSIDIANGKSANNVFSDTGLDGISYTEQERAQLLNYINDERLMQSMRSFIDLSGDKALLIRPDAFLAVIMISDEVDGSRAEGTTDTGGQAVSDYLQDLIDEKGDGNFSVFSITDLALSPNPIKDLATQAGGISFDINGTSAEYNTNLGNIATNIIQQSAFYALSCPANESTLSVKLIDGTSGLETIVPPVGYTYEAARAGISFNPGYFPSVNSAVSIDFDPLYLGCTPGAGIAIKALSLSSTSIPENSSNGTELGTVTIENVQNGAEEDYTYSILSDTTGGAFAIDSITGVVTVVNGTLLDTEVQAFHQLEVQATDGTTDLETIFLIAVQDVSDVTPIANADGFDDQYTVSETAAVNEIITITGNVSFNDSNLDSADIHSFTPSVDPTPSNTSATLTIDPTGDFTFTVDITTLTLGAGVSDTLTYTYTIFDGVNTSNTGNINFTVEGQNQAPIINTANLGAIPDVNINAIGNPSVGAIPYLDTAVTESGAGADFTTKPLISTVNAQGYHSIDIELPDLNASGKSILWEVDNIVLTGPSGYDFGNSIFQLIYDDGVTEKVLSREVLAINQGNSLTVTVTSPVIGNRIRILRPSGAVNDAGDDDLQLSTLAINAKEIIITCTEELSKHFTDPNLAAGDELTYFLSDAQGEGPAPSWAYLATNSTIPSDDDKICFRAPNGTDIDLTVIAQDLAGSTLVQTFNVERNDGGTPPVNSAPIALLQIADQQRGGLTLKRYGGFSSSAPNSQSIQWDEADEFLDQSLDASGEFIHAVYPTDFDGENHHGPGEDGWAVGPTSITDKFAQDGQLIPLIDSQREYGETYSGFFAPAGTGIYRFRTTSVDDVLRILVSPTEYLSDLVPIFTATINTSRMRQIMEDSLVYSDPLGLAPATGLSTANEFAAGYGSGHDTSTFFQGGIAGYKAGYVYLKQGNIYSTQIRFMEGGGAVRFNFQYDYKPNAAAAWTGWKPMDSSVIVPKEGTDGHTPLEISSAGGVNYDSSTLFYDAELDVLEYSATLVNADGSASASILSDIGLVINNVTGVLSGTLSNPLNLRIVFSATDTTGSLASVEYLPVKFN